MGRISTGIGLVSGINSRDIIDQLMSLEARPKQLLQKRIDQTNAQKLAYTDISTRLTGLKVSALTLKKTTTFQAASATTSNENVLTATAANGAATGSFSFQVSRLVTSQQSVSSGFADTDTQRVGAGTITLEMGGGEVYSQALLSQLNGGTGVQRGSFRITDRSGKSAVIDISSAFTLDDVVRKINTSLDISVKASITGDGLTLTDLTGQAINDLTVTDLADGTTAANLGIVGTSGGSDTLVGTNINTVGRKTALSQLNDGLGVRGVSGQPDFEVFASDGTSFTVSIGTAANLGAVIDAINTAGGAAVTASISASGDGISLTDNTGGGGAFAVGALNGSLAAKDLGIEQSVFGGVMTGRSLVASLNSVMLSTLRGGTGLNLGTISITDGNGASSIIDLSNASSLQDVLDAISNDNNISVTARIKDSGNGIEIIDNSGGTGDLIIADDSSTTAAELGIAGTFAAGTNAVGANLQRQWVNEKTVLSGYNGGRGVSLGKVEFTNSNSISTTIDFSTATYNTLGDVINKINSTAIGITASINANGDGLLLSDTAGGPTLMSVEDVNSSTAKDLRILGSAATGQTTIDGSFEVSYTVGATDTLDDVLDLINLPGFGAAATIINDGSGDTPHRLSLTARNTGRAGRFLFDAGTTSLGARKLVEAQDAAVFYGSADAAEPLVITSSSNQLTGVIKGVTIDLHGVSSSPVSLSVASNINNVVTELEKFTESFNGLATKIRELTDYDAETNKRGLLLGESTAQRVEAEIYRMLQTVVPGSGKLRILSDIGLRVGKEALLEFDAEKFRAAYSDDADAVREFFTLFEAATTTTTAKRGIGTILEDAINKLTDPVTGIITRENNTLDRRTDDFQDRIGQLDKLLESKRLRLESQFANLESVLANLQNQQQSISSLANLQLPASNSRR